MEHQQIELRYLEQQKPLWEKNILQLSGQIRGKPNWWEKFNNDEIFNKWKQEVSDQCKIKPPDTNPRYLFLGDQIDETFDAIKTELEYDSALIKLTWPFLPGVSRDIFYADNVVLDATKQRLKEIVSQTLENVPADQIDWHPGSSGLVRDLVHPSLYVLKYGYTCGCHEDGSVRPIDKPKALVDKSIGVEHGLGSGSSYQWLPSVFEIENTETTGRPPKYNVKIKSYINNLHPALHKELYSVIEEVFAAALPGLTYVLSNAQEEDPIRSQIPDMEDLANDEYKRLENECRRAENYLAWDELAQRKHEYLKPIKSLGWKPLEKPTAPNSKFHMPQNLKVITKLANIELTPESPEYTGGSWHLEGTSAENIVATVLYYYDNDNITESRLSFRASIDDDIMGIGYEQEDIDGVFFAYGLGRELPCVNNLGSMKCQEDRVLVFPNMIQHHVDSFKLEDPTRPGHRKIMCFFICNPGNSDIWATDKVPYQNQEWIRDGIGSATDTESNNLLCKLPVEIQNSIFWHMGVMDWNMAVKELDLLMKERGAGSLLDKEYFDEERTFYLCEH